MAGGIDTSMYSNINQLDILGGLKQGMQLRGQMDQRAQAEVEREEQSQLAEAQKASMVVGPDGKFMIDQNKLGSNIMALAGRGNRLAANAGMTLGQNMTQQQREQDKWQNTLRQQEIDNQYREKALASAAADRAEARNERRYQAGVALNEKTQALQTPYGLANTPDDAKQLKDGYLAKQAFDNKLQQMIDLRTNNNGGALFNREDVARGKQLSKDLLLEYKNMAKLGVLSKSDEDIINAIIPEDPLEYNSPLASIQGQDPTLQRMKAFQADSTKNFNDAIATRTRGGMSQLNQSPTAAIGARSGLSELSMSPRATKADNEAVQWAKNNQKDPRAAAILKANGYGG